MKLRWRWAIWLIIVIVCAGGLRRYRVDNSIDQWMPELAPAQAGGLVFIGGFAGSDEADQFAMGLSGESAIAGCLSPGVARLQDIEPVGLVLSEDRQYAGVICFAASGVGDAELVAVVRRHVGTRRLALAGPAIFREAVNVASQQRLNVIMVLIALVGTLLTWATVGSLRLALLAVGALLSAQVALLGAISWTGRPIDMTLSMVPPLMMALGFSYAAHHMLRRSAGVALVLCGVTTLLGIGSFATTPVPPVRDFAIWGMAGLLLTWCAIVALTPAAGALERSHPQLDRVWSALARGNVWLVQRYGAWVLLLAALGSVAGIVVARKVTIQTDPLRYFHVDTQIVHDYRQLNERLTGMLPSLVQFEGQADATDMLKGSEGVRYVLDLGRLNETQSGQYLILADESALPQLATAQARWRQWATQHNASFQWTGVAAQLHGMGRLVLVAAVGTLPVMALVVTVVIAGITGNLLKSVVGLWVNLMPVAGLLLVAAALRWPLGLPALMIGAIAVGVAVDDTIHLALAWREHGSWRQMLADNVRPSAGSSIVAAACLALFGLCPFLPTSQFGVMLSLAIIAALIGDLLVFAAFLRCTNWPLNRATR